MSAWDSVKWTFDKLVSYAAFRVVTNPTESLATVAILSNPTLRGILFRSGGSILKYELLDWGGRARLYGGILARESAVIDAALLGGRGAAVGRLIPLITVNTLMVTGGVVGAYMIAEGPRIVFEHKSDPNNLALTMQSQWYGAGGTA